MASLLLPLRYALTNTLLIVFLITLAIGGWWVWTALGLTLAIGGALDEAAGEHVAAATTRGGRLFYDVNLYATLPLILVITGLMLHLMALQGRSATNAASLAALAIGGGDPAAILGGIIGTGYFYALAGATVAHELVHRGDDRLATISAPALLALTFNPTFASYHIHGHHRYVGTYGDPATARRGEYIMTFVVRTIIFQSLSGWRIEACRLRLKGRRSFSILNRVLLCTFFSLAFLLVAWMSAAWLGLLAFLAAAILGRVLHELVNYVQHYGLVRVEGSPVEPRHAWDTYRPFSSFLQYNLPRHSYHHMFAAKPFWELEAVADAPKLPHGYKTMVMIAFFSTHWRQAMNPLLADWDRRLASDGERALLRRRGWSLGEEPGRVT